MMSYEKMLKEIKDYGPMRIRLWDGLYFYLISAHPRKPGFLAVSHTCAKIKPKEYFIRHKDINEITD